MGLLARIFRRGKKPARRTSATLADPVWMHELGHRTVSGVTVTPDTAMRVTTVYACVRLISETIGTLPLHLYRRDGRKKEIATDHPLYELLHDAPNPLMTSVQMREQMQAALLLEGNAYARIIRDNLGEVKEILPIHPSRVQVRPSRSGRNLVYIIDGGKERYLSGDIWHITGFSLDGLMGVSPISYHREAVGVAMAAERHAAAVLGNNARPSGILSHPGELDDEAIKKLRESWQAAHGGDNVGGVAVLEEGMEFKPLTMSMQDLQYIETRKFSRAEITALFRVPLHMVNDLERATFSNIEHQGLEFKSYTVLPWAVRWEASIRRDLLLPGERKRYFARYNLEGLHRGDMKTRFDVYTKAIQWGIYSPNEARELEERDPREGGDVYLSPLNMEPSGSLETADEEEGNDAESEPEP